MNKSFLKSMNFEDAILIDARYGVMPVAIATELMGGKPKRQRPPAKRWTWEDCRALTKHMGVLIGYDHVEFPVHNGKYWTTTAFESGKSYSYKYNSPKQCYEALLSLQRDRLARLSDAKAIAAGQDAKQFF